MGMQDMAFPRVQFSKMFPRGHAPGPPYISRGIGADTLFVSPVTTFQLQKKPPYLDQTNDDTESG